MPRGHWERFLRLPLPTDARLWLVVNGTTTNRGQRETIRDHGLREIPLKDLRAALREGRRSPDGAPKAEPFPKVPGDECPLFLDLCRELLTANEFQLVATEYWRGFRLAQDWVGKGSPGIARLEPQLQAFTARLLRETTTIDELLAALRGAESALFLRYYLLGVDIDALAAGYLLTPRATLAHDAARRLRRLSAPHLATAGVLALLTIPDPHVIAGLDLDDVDRDGSFFEVEHTQVPIPPVARGIVRAHLAYRRVQGAAAGDPLFVSEGPQAWSRARLQRTTPHGIQQRLRQVALETGVPVSTSEGWARTEKRWLARRGSTLRELRRAT